MPMYHPTAQVLHWITALAVIGMLGVGLWMTSLPLGLTKLNAYNWHKWIGVAVLVLTVGRLLWRWRRPPPPLPGTIVRWQAVLAPVVHWALLTLLLAMAISGWLMSSAAGVGVVWFGLLPLPDLAPRDPALFELLKTTHYFLSRLLIAVLILHIAAVAHHDVLRRDGVFRRMWPYGGR
jgi:cytochrome b561